MTDASVALSVPLFNVLWRETIIRTWLSEPLRFNTHLNLLDSTPFVNTVYVCVCPQVILLPCTVPVSRTEDRFVFQSQPVETRGSWREEEVKRRITEGWDSVRYEQQTGNGNTIYIIRFRTEVTQCIAGRSRTTKHNHLRTKSRRFKSWEKGREDERHLSSLRQTLSTWLGLSAWPTNLHILISH